MKRQILFPAIIFIFAHSLSATGCTYMIPKGYTGWISDLEVGRLHAMFEANPVTITFQDMEVRFDLPEETVQVADRLTLENITSAPASSAFLSLPYGSRVLSIEDSTGTSVSFTATQCREHLGPRIFNKVRFDLPSPIEPGQKVEATIRYEWEVNDLASEIDEDAIVLASNFSWHPMAKIDLYSHFFDDHFDYHARVLAPPGHFAFMDGELLETDEVGGLAKFSWKSWTPTSSLYLHSRVFDLETYSFDDSTIDFLLSHKWECTKNTVHLAGEAARALAFFEERFGPRGFGGRSVTIMETWPNLKAIGGSGNSAMKNAIQLKTLTMRELNSTVESWSGSGPPEEIDPVRIFYHELSHLWWGSSIDPEGYGWKMLTEGLANFSAAAMLGRRFGKEKEKEIFNAYRVKYLKKRESVPFLSRPPYNEYTRETFVYYSKGPLFYRMLGGLLGEEVLWAGIRAFHERHRGGRPCVADCQAVMEEVSGEELGWFFDQWLGTIDLPDYVIDGVQSDEGEEGYRYRVAVTNRGENRMPVEVACLIDGEKGPVRGESVRVWIEEKDSVQVELTSPIPARSVEVDPDKIVIQSDYGNDVWELE